MVGAGSQPRPFWIIELAGNARRELSRGEKAIGIVGTLLKNRRAGESNLAWNLPGLSGSQTLEVMSPAFADGAAIPVEHAGKRSGGRQVSPPLSWTAPPARTAELQLVMEDVDTPMGSPFVHCVALISPEVPAVADQGRVADAKPRAVLASVAGPVLARARLTGVYER
jgi:hypothetical protein